MGCYGSDSQLRVLDLETRRADIQTIFDQHRPSKTLEDTFAECFKKTFLD